MPGPIEGPYPTHLPASYTHIVHIHYHTAAGSPTGSSCSELQKLRVVLLVFASDGSRMLRLSVVFYCLKPWLVPFFHSLSVFLLRLPLLPRPDCRLAAVASEWKWRYQLVLVGHMIGRLQDTCRAESSVNRQSELNGSNEINFNRHCLKGHIWDVVSG